MDNWTKSKIETDLFYGLLERELAQSRHPELEDFVKMVYELGHSDGQEDPRDRACACQDL